MEFLLLVEAWIVGVKVRGARCMRYPWMCLAAMNHTVTCTLIFLLATSTYSRSHPLSSARVSRHDSLPEATFHMPSTPAELDVDKSKHTTLHSVASKF